MTLIYKEELLEEYDKMHVGEPGRARKLIDEAPPVEAEPVRHGHWRYIHDSYPLHVDYPFHDEWECSICGVVFEDERPSYKYCPNCGAKMDEEPKSPCEDCQEWDCSGCKYEKKEETDNA